jgi:DNA repair exonuclease SbcCD nuclease subunit
MIYLSADNHLSRLVWKRRKELAGDSYRVFHAMVDAIIADPVQESKALVLAGDVTDRAEVDAATFQALDEASEKLAEADIPVFYVMGNHDLDEPDWPGQFGFVCLDGKTARLDDRRVAGLSYRPRERLLEDLAKQTPCDILVMHQAFEHLLGFTDAFDLKLDDIPAQIGNVVVGDIHTPDLTPLQGRGWCLSPGSTIARKISETHVPGYWQLARGVAAKPTFCALPHRSILRVEVASVEDLPKLLQMLGEPGRNPPVVELAFPLELSVAAEQFMAEQQERAVFFPRPGTTGKIMEEAAERPTFDKLTLLSALPLLQLADKDPDAHGFLQALLTCPNVDAFLEEKVATAKTP